MVAQPDIRHVLRKKSAYVGVV